jgi:hypothetical protein
MCGSLIPTSGGIPEHCVTVVVFLNTVGQKAMIFLNVAGQEVLSVSY